MKPNILYIFSDQHRFCDVGYAGNPEVETPNLDALAADSAWYSASYSNCPLCVPARGTILTGKHALKHGAAANDLPIHNDTESIADVLNAAGYQTGYIGKWHLGGVPRDKSIPEGERLGFSFWNGCECNHDYLNAYYDDNNNVRHSVSGYEPEEQTHLAIRFMEQFSKEDAPWALWLSYGTPHEPYHTQPEEERAYWENKNLTMRPNVDLDHMEFSYGPKPDIPHDYAGYYGHIRLLDRQIGRLTAWLKDRGEWENTIVVYTSDHGDMLGSHGFMNKQLYYEESAKVPLIISWPGKIPAGERTQLISLADHAPTLLGLLGAKALENADGTDQSDTLRYPDAPGQEAVYLYSYVPCHQACFRELPSWRAIVSDSGMKYVTDQNHTPVALFDTRSDPHEMRNLLDDSKYTVFCKKMDALLSTQTAIHDGYEPWENLLRKHGLWDSWSKSEKHFQQVWAHFATDLQ